MKKPVIELIEYNFLLSLFDYIEEYFKDKEVHGKPMKIIQSYSDNNIEYTSPSLSLEILRRKNKSVGFNNYLFNIDEGNTITEVDGILFKYSVQLNVYSNTRGENHKWCSILDELLRIGENGIPINSYLDNGDIKESNIGLITYNYSEVKNNNFPPSVITYDFHSAYEFEMSAIQKYTEEFDITTDIDVFGNIK